VPARSETSRSDRARRLGSICLGLAVTGVAALSVAAGPTSGVDCESADVIAPVVADTWLDENSPFAPKGTDSVLDVDAGSLNVDTGEASGRSRALLRFAMPAAVPEGCVVASARLFVYSSEESVGARVEAVRLASAWAEGSVSWSDQPATLGGAVRIWSREGFMQWNVTDQVKAMLDGEVGHGFLIRDAAEGAETGGGGHGFYSREKGDSATLPHLVIRFATPGVAEAPGPPLPPEPATVTCGQVLTESTLVTNDLAECLGDGLVIGVPRIIVDLGGHTIDGIGLGSGIRNEGHALVTIRNGTLQEFDYGVQLFPETVQNVVEGVTLRANQVAAIELFDVADSEVLDNVLDGNGGGIDLVSGTHGSVVANNAITANGKAGLFLQDATDNRLERNTVAAGGDLGIGLERASANVLIGNTSTGNSDGGIELRDRSHANRLEGNTVTDSGDHGIWVSESDGNQLIGNVAHFMSDSGITLDSANDGVVRDNDVRFNTGGLQLDGASRNVIESNDASETSGIGIELGGGSLENLVERNTADGNGAQGIYVGDDATDPLGNPIPELGNLLLANTANDNLADGIVVAKGGHTIADNFTRDNLGWGILAALVGTIDGSGNVATGNGKPEQCIGVVCKEEWVPPETTIDSGPDLETSSASATFRFSGEDDTTPSTALTFQCSLDEGRFAACSSTRTFDGLSAGPHTFRVRATDRAGNTDTSPAEYPWSIDLTPPDTQINARPADPSKESTASFAFGGNDNVTDASALRFECRIDGAADAPWAACSSPHQLADLVEGIHGFEVRAVDRVGNVDTSPASYTWTVDRTPPTTTIEPDGAPADPTTATDAAFAFSADEAATFACSLDAGEPAACNDGTAAYGELGEGSHTFAVAATDAAGNLGPAAQYTWTVEAPDGEPVDRTPPETEINDRPANPTNSTSARFAFAGSDDVTEVSALRFQCRLDSGDELAWAACTSPHDTPVLSAGAHTFEVRAIDQAGNADASPASYGWTVDTTPPHTTLADRPANPTNSTAARFTFSATESGSTFQCRLDSAVEAAWAPCSSPHDTAVLSAGAHTFEVRAIDAASNIDASPASYGWTVDTTQPNTSITGGPAANSTTFSTSASFTFTGTDNATPAASLTFQCSLDSATVFGSCSSPQPYTNLTVGSHTFRVRAIDAAGNVDGSPASRAWTVEVISGCGAPVILAATADAWIEQNSASSNRGSDSILKVKSQGAADNFRALVQFALPDGAPAGCVLESATLRLYAASATSGRTLEASALAAAWTEGGVTWGNQPLTNGTAVTTSSGSGYREWVVTSHVQAMNEAGTSHGFLIRDMVEGSSGMEQSFHAREKGESPPQLVIRYAPEPSAGVEGSRLALARVASGPARLNPLI
jgi:large repetitive protein